MISDQIGFIVGTGRCGTTLAAQFINAHSDICVPHELQFVVELIRSFDGRNVEEFGAEELAQVIERACPHNFLLYFDYVAFLRDYPFPVKSPSAFSLDLFAAVAASRGKRRFVEQTPWYGLHLELLARSFPESRFVHMVRDGRDVALSFSRTPWWYDDPRQNLRRWAEEIAAIADAAETHLGRDRYLVVRYEDIVLEPEANVTLITKFLGAEFETGQLSKERHVDYARYNRKSFGNDIFSSPFNAWKKQRAKDAVFTGSVFAYKDRSDALFTDLPRKAVKELERFGYDV